MKKFLYLLFFVFIFATGASAQVTIGSTDAPAAGALLELKSTTLGFLPPRVTLTSLTDPAPLTGHVQGMVVFNSGTALPVGLYFNNGTQWMHLANPTAVENWFYMPSIVFDVSKTATAQTKDLYAEYAKQFTTPTNPSSGAPTKVLSTLPAKDKLWYYITAFDDKVFKINSLNADGVLNYDVIGAASDSTYINIVFVEK